MRNRAIGAIGLAVAAAAFGWALADGGRDSVTALVVIGLVVTGADVMIWRSAAFGIDLAVPDGRVVPAPAWGWLLGPSAAVGLMASVIAGSVAGGVIAGAVLIGTLVGPLRSQPPGAISSRVADVARGLRLFVRMHGAAEGASVPGYLSSVGHPGVRLFVTAPDGAWAEAMVARDADLVAELARIELSDQVDPVAGRLVRVDRPFWEQMTASW